MGNPLPLHRCLGDFSSPGPVASACSVCLPSLTLARRRAPANAFPRQPSLAVFAAASSLCTEVSCKIYLCSFCVCHCSSHVQQDNYIPAQKNEQNQSFCPLSLSCLPVCSLPIQSCLKQSFPLNISKTSPSPPLISNLFY